MNGVHAEVGSHEYSVVSGPARPVRHRAGLGFVLGGLAIVGAALGLVAASDADPSESPASVMPASDSAVSIAELTYAPGHSSGWHLHYGVHSVVVLGGTLTVYDEACQRRDYGPGTSYLGGALPHLARNEARDELRVAITSVYRQSSSGEHGTTVSAPTGCESI